MTLFVRLYVGRDITKWYGKLSGMDFCGFRFSRTVPRVLDKIKPPTMDRPPPGTSTLRLEHRPLSLTVHFKSFLSSKCPGS